MRQTKTQPKKTANYATNYVLAVAFGLAVVVSGTSAWSAPGDVPAVGVANVLTYQAWKSLRMDEARLVLERMTYENQLEKMPQIERSPIGSQVKPVAAKPVKGGRAERADARIEQARMNLEIAQDLTVNDYLVIYLSQFKSREAMVDVARRMAPEEVADLLISHQKMSSGGQVAEHTLAPSPRLSPRPL